MRLLRCLIFLAFCKAPAQLTEFTGWSLLRPTSSNVVSYVTEANELLEVRAGVPYQELVLHASSNLATNASEIRAKLVFATAAVDDDCLPGRASEVPNIVLPRVPVPTALDGDTPGVTPAETYENRWGNARFPYSGAFKVCYMDLSGSAAWRLAAAPFDVVGTGANSFEFWCLGDVTIDCQLQIAGLGLKTNWYLTVVPMHSVCGAVDFAGSFDQNVSTITSEAGSETSATHSLGTPVTSGAGTFAVCFCPGYNVDSSGASCTVSEDFVQLSGILYVTEALPVQNPHPQLLFTLRVLCGGAGEGGCPASAEPRIKIVDAAASNSRPAFDALSGCRTAAQSASYMSPENCESPTRCTLPPAVASSTSPEWANLRLFPTFENKAQKPMLYDVCLCLGSCDQSANWFKAGSIQTSVIQVLPQPIVANKVLDLQLLGTLGGWSPASGAAPELKFLDDDEGAFGATRLQRIAESLAGHFCLTNTDCKAPTASSVNGHVWEGIRFLFAGMYAVCYCEQQCRSPVQWSLLEWKLVEGPSRHHSWQRYRGLLFDLTLNGFGLGAGNRVAVFPDGLEGYRASR
ncbi:Ank3 [Symbiodinium natans]|uniref:Ank3 protein n=1 Tax=Symbiodinium natans TaxID=878477 RepID=A0A812P688_9DINO|nr:Ank3 [Symbiodinium natans]